MENFIKKTISIRLGAEIYIIALMTKIGFKEINRITNGDNGRIHITFLGLESDYHENDYVKVKDSYDFFTFYSLRIIDGCYTKKFSDFKLHHDNMKEDFEIFSFDDQANEFEG